MPPVRLKIAQIGNSRGVRLPAATLRRFRIGDTVIMEERSDGILLRPVVAAATKLSWADTAREMAASTEDWREWDSTVSDGLDAIPWAPNAANRGAEKNPADKTKALRKPRR